MSADILTYGLLAVALVALILTYGKIRFQEGRRTGYVAGSLKSTAQLITFLEEAGVVGLTNTGDIYRVTDDGERGKVVFDAMDALRKLGTNVKSLEDKLEKELDTN